MGGQGRGLPLTPAFGLQFEQARLGFEAAGEAGEFAGGSYDAMAGHDYRQRVPAICRTHSAASAGIAELLCELPVTSGFAEGNGQQRLPDTCLKPSAAHIEVDRKKFSFAGEVFA
jgi:hypothetical protein